MLYTCEHGDIIRRLNSGENAGLYEVRTDFTKCLVDTELNADGEFFVDLPGNWLHTEEEADEARHLARLILNSYFSSLRPQIKPVN